MRTGCSHSPNFWGGDGSQLPAVLGVCVAGLNWHEKKAKPVKMRIKTDNGVLSLLGRDFLSTTSESDTNTDHKELGLNRKPQCPKETTVMACHKR